MLVSGCQTAWSGMLCLLTWHLSLLEVSFEFRTLDEKKYKWRAKFLCIREIRIKPEPIGTGTSQLCVRMEFWSSCMWILSRLYVKSSPCAMCSCGLESFTILHFDNPCFVPIHTTWTTHRDRNWWMQDSPSCVLSRVIVSRHTQTVCKRKSPGEWYDRDAGK